MKLSIRCCNRIAPNTNLRLFPIFITVIIKPAKDSTTNRKFKVGMFLLHIRINGFIIIDMIRTDVYAESYETKSVNRLNYGIYFKYVDTINVVNDNFLTTVKIAIIQRSKCFTTLH